MTTDVQAILIAGPTASGKSAFAHALAERLSATVINADSMQVYRDLRILTARPTGAEMRRVPYRLYGHVQGEEAYSAARYADEAQAAIGEAHLEGRLPIIVGGTGLYFKALLEGLSPIPPVPDEIRDRWREAAAKRGPTALHAILTVRDPVMAARLRPTDPQRIVRALEVLEATGTSLARWQEVPGRPLLPFEACRAIVISPPRDVLHHRIESRFDAMLREGAAEEVRALSARGLDPDLPVMRALGVRPIKDMLAGRLTSAEVSERVKAETRQYAKRQVTWLRSNMRAWKWVNTQDWQSLDRSLCDFVKL